MSSIYLKPLFEKKADPVTQILRDIFKDNNFALPYLGALTLGLGVAQSSNVSAQDNLEEVVVTASKRSENLQDVPMSVQAIGAAELDLKNVKGLDDIANLSPPLHWMPAGQVILLFISEVSQMADLEILQEPPQQQPYI